MTTATDAGDTLYLDEGVNLGHALIAFLASESQIPALFLKGPTLNLLEICTDRQSSDVDVLVPPAETARLEQCVKSRGWVRRRGDNAPRLIPMHSVTYFHPSWPCDVDIHDMYPGVFLPADAAFDHLWNRRTQVWIGNQLVHVPCAVDSALILVMHSVREIHSLRAISDLEAVQAFLAAGGADRWSDFLNSARALRGIEVIQPFLERCGSIPSARDALGVIDLTDTERRAWAQLLANEGLSTAYLWISTIAATRGWRNRCVMAVRAVRTFIRPDSDLGELPATDVAGGVRPWARVPEFVADLRVAYRRQRALRRGDRGTVS